MNYPSPAGSSGSDLLQQCLSIYIHFFLFVDVNLTVQLRMTVFLIRPCLFVQRLLFSSLRFGPHLYANIATNLPLSLPQHDKQTNQKYSMWGGERKERCVHSQYEREVS